MGSDQERDPGNHRQRRQIADVSGGESTGPRVDRGEVAGRGTSPYADPATSSDTGASGGDESAGAPGVPGGIDDGSLAAPVYPRESRLRGEEGTVVVEVIVDADGTPARYRVIDDAGYPRLARAALAAMRKARFRPAAAAYRVTKPFKFTLHPSR